MFSKLRNLFKKTPSTTLTPSPIDDITKRIRELEAEGHTAATSSELHALNVARTNAMSTQELLDVKEERRKQGKPTTQIDAALKDRNNTKRIHELQSQGHTARTSSELHTRNVARTNSMSTGQLQSVRAQRIAEGKPVGQIDAALRDRP